VPKAETLNRQSAIVNSVDAILEFSNISKAYGGLRPLRLRSLSIAKGAIVGLSGLDQTTAEVFVNLATGATLPEEGTVRVFGQATSAIADSADWLALVDRFGIVSERVVLLEQFTPLQNIAMALTLDVEPLPPDVRRQAEALAQEAGLEADSLDRPVADGGVALRHRVRLARALALSPAVLLIEHPVAGLEAREIAPLARDITRAAESRGLSAIVLAADVSAATPFAQRVLTLNGATGELSETRRTGLLGRLKKAVTGSD
jgi:ABC-type transporter Mla maintaining outer membrane lipid asymmetry ATPase subunit MlaF